MSVEALLVLLLFVFCAWTHIILMDGGNKESRDHLRRVTGEIAVSIGAGALAAQFLRPWLDEYLWTTGIAAGVATYLVLLRRDIARYRAAKRSTGA